MNRIRGWILLGIGFGFTTWVSSCGGGNWAYAQTPKPLAQQTSQELDAHYQALSAQLPQETDREKAGLIEAEEVSISQELDRRILADLQANDAALDAIGQQIQAATVQIEGLAHRKWCHQTLWRRLRGYREPGWCH